MVIYGWYQDIFLNERPKDLTCLNCAAKSISKVRGEASVFHIMYIPMFSYKSLYEVECLNCKTVSKLEHYKNYKYLKRPRLKQIWYFSGIILILALISWNFYSNKQDQLVYKGRLENIEKNRIIQFKNEESKFTSLKIAEVKDDSISLVFNKFVVDNKSSLESILKPKNYEGDTISFKREILIKWFEEEKIINIHW